MEVEAEVPFRVRAVGLHAKLTLLTVTSATTIRPDRTTPSPSAVLLPASGFHRLVQDWIFLQLSLAGVA